MTINQLFKEISTKLKAITDAPNLEAELIISHELGVSREYLLSEPQTAIEDELAQKVHITTGTRVNGKPLSQITATKHFHNNAFEVNDQVLTPRNDTEILLTESMQITDKLLRKPGSSHSILEIGIGSGALLISLVSELINSSTNEKYTISGSDISPAAIELTNRNARSIIPAITNNPKFDFHIFISDLFENIDDRYDLIISNPPYLPTYGSYPKELDYEPAEALFAGEEGLDFYCQLFKEVTNYLVKGGYVAIEIHPPNIERIKNIAESSAKNLKLKKVAKDLAGRNRVLIFQLDSN